MNTYDGPLPTVSDSWMRQAACKKMTDVFYPVWSPASAPGREAREQAELAVKICERCPVIDDCVKFAASLPWTELQFQVLAGVAPWDWREAASPRQLASKREVASRTEAQRRRDEICEAIRQGCTTIPLLVERLDLSIGVVKDSILRLRTEGRIETAVPSGGRGRPAVWRAVQ